MNVEFDNVLNRLISYLTHFANAMNNKVENYDNITAEICRLMDLNDLTKVHFISGADYCFVNGARVVPLSKDTFNDWQKLVDIGRQELKYRTLSVFCCRVNLTIISDLVIDYKKLQELYSKNGKPKLDFDQVPAGELSKMIDISTQNVWVLKEIARRDLPKNPKAKRK